MKHVRQNERRREDRFPQSFGVNLRVLPHLGAIEATQATTFSARIQNISAAGMCLLTDEEVERFSVLRCEVPVADTDQPVATLMQVRWVQQQNSSPGSFLFGLKALL
jgi:hypothetical protein